MTELPKSGVNRAIKLMLIGLLLACIYVIFRSCETPKTGWDSYATGELSKLIVLDDPKAQPQIAFKDASGADVSLGDFRGDVLLLNVWATWCAPCLEEMPSLNALAAQPPIGNLKVVAISVDRKAEEATDFLDSLDLDALDFYHDPTFGVARSLDAPGLPVTVIYNADGREMARLVGGADWNSPEARRLIEAIASR